MRKSELHKLCYKTPDFKKVSIPDSLLHSIESVSKII